MTKKAKKTTNADARIGRDGFGGADQGRPLPRHGRRRAGRGSIGDFGAKIDGARKDAVGANRATPPLATSWPAPHYVKLIADGCPPDVVALVRALREAVEPRPRHPNLLETWQADVATIRDLCEDLLARPDNCKEPAACLSDLPIFYRAEEILLKSELYLHAGHDRSLRHIKLEKFGGLNGAPDEWCISKPCPSGHLPGSGWRKYFIRVASKEEALAQFRTVAAAERIAGRSRPTPFVVYTGEDGRAFIAPGRSRRPIPIREFPDTASAEACLEAGRPWLEAVWAEMKRIPAERREGSRERVGEDWRHGGDIRPDTFETVFRFRGVQFGNYVEQARRQRDLNDAHDALLDMAGVLALPTRALSLNGELGLAFGARGKGGRRAFKAHYERTHAVINLTKRSGAGSLAHEWWHGLDHFLARSAGAADGMISNPETAPESGLADGILKAAASLRKVLARAPVVKRVHALDRRRSSPYYSRPTEISARAFEVYVISKLAERGARNDYLASIVPADAWRVTPACDETGSTYPYPLASEMPAIAEAFDRLFRALSLCLEDGRFLLHPGAGGPSG